MLFFGYLMLTVASYLLRRYIAQKFNNRSRLVNVIFFLILYPVGVTIAIILRPDLNIGWQNLLIIIAASAVYPIINLLIYRANKTLDAGHFALLGNMAPVVSIVLAVLILHETMTTEQVIGAVIVLISAIVATFKKLNKTTLNFSTGVKVALVGIFLAGIGTVFEVWMLGRIDFGAYLVYGWGAQTLWMLVFGWKDLRNISKLKDRQFAMPVLSYALINALRSALFVAALFVSASASIISAALGVVPVLVVIAAYVFLKERGFIVRRMIAGALGLVGLTIIYMS
ncbi:MAG: EamA family transporter [Gammaproteobacteria bacterium]|nr:EamA family transporter [Gammaproteobacteria bacterium]